MNSMTTSVPPTQEPTVYQPSADQLARDAALRRFNRLYVALPLTLAIIAALIILGLFVYLIFAPDSEASIQFISNLADIIIILAIIPMMMMVAIVPLAYLAFVVNHRQNRPREAITGPMANRSRVQGTLWRIDNALGNVKNKTNETAPKISRPFAELNARFEEVDAWQKQLRRSDDTPRE